MGFKKHTLKIDRFNPISTTLGTLANVYKVFCRELQLIQIGPCRSVQAWASGSSEIEENLRTVQNYTVSVQACNLVIFKWAAVSDMELRKEDQTERLLIKFPLVLNASPSPDWTVQELQPLPRRPLFLFFTF